MTHSAFVRALKVLLKLAGFDPALFSGHSFRRGGATDGMEMTGKQDQVQLLGDWTSDAYLRYHQVSKEYTLELPTLMAQNAASLVVAP